MTLLGLVRVTCSGCVKIYWQFVSWGICDFVGETEGSQYL